jgi:hypothetical protein
METPDRLASVAACRLRLWGFIITFIGLPAFLTISRVLVDEMFNE